MVIRNVVEQVTGKDKKGENRRKAPGQLNAHTR